MAIQVRGRGYPLLMTATDDGTLIWTLNGATTSAAFTSGAILSATTFSGSDLRVTDVKATTISATTMSATVFSGAIAGSAGECRFEMSAAAAGNHLICGGALNGTTAACGVSGNAVLVVTYSGRNYYIPAFSAVAYA